MKKLIIALPVGVMSIAMILITAYLSLSSHPIGADMLPSFYGVDKCCHALLYALVTVAFLFDYVKFRLPHSPKTSIELALMASAMVLGMFMEAGQLAITDERFFEFYDVLANAIGAFIGWGWYKLWGRHSLRSYYFTRYRRHHHRRDDGAMTEY